MSAMHQQAMKHVYQQVLSRLLGSFSPARRAAVQPLIQRLMSAAGGAQRLGNYRVVLMVCGSAAGNANLAVLRAAQLTLAARHQPTFSIRAAISSHALLDDIRNRNMQRACNALFLHDDSRVELLTLDDEAITPYEHRNAAAPARRVACRTELLASGHRLDAASHAALQKHGHQAMARFYQRVLAYKSKADAIVLDQPALQRRRFVVWAMRDLRRRGVAPLRREHWHGNSCLQLIDPGVAAKPQGHRVDGAAEVQLLPAHDLLSEPSAVDGQLWQFLGCETPTPLFSPGEARYPQLAWFAHVHGLRSQWLQAGSYEAGLESFLGCTNSGLFGDLSPAPKLRKQVVRAAGEHVQARLFSWYAMEQAHLSCAVFTPFVGRGARLEAFLAACHPGMLVTMPYLHKGLRGAKVPAQVVQWLESTSGLPLATLQGLYRSPGSA